MNKNDTSQTIYYFKSLGKNHSDENLNTLLTFFQDKNLPIDVRREIVSSIGRQDNDDIVLDFIRNNVFTNLPMDLIYQMYRTCLIKSKYSDRFSDLASKIKKHYKNEVIDKMTSYYFRSKLPKNTFNSVINKPTLLCGDASSMLRTLPDSCLNLVFTSPPYYNAREYSDYKSYDVYLDAMKQVFKECVRVLETGRFFIVNTSPVITKRPGRNFESIRYPISYDFHSIFKTIGLDFVDEIYWIKPEPSVPNRIGGYLQNRKALAYKPNCITESIMVYRKSANFLIDKNQQRYHDYNKYLDEPIDTTNCWYISPKTDKGHPAVFPDELCRKILRYYSFEKDVVLDPFAGSGTFGRVALDMNRIPVLCEMNEDYISLINERSSGCYDLIPAKKLA